MYATEFSVIARIFLFPCLFFALNISDVQADTETLSPLVIDAQGPKGPWGKSIGDVDNDGDIDILVGGNESVLPSIYDRIRVKLGLIEWPDTGGDLVWYENPTWKKHFISDDFRIRTDLEVSDITGDGVNDIVALTDAGVVLFKGPQFEQSTIIYPAVSHDIEAVDLNNDGLIDLVLRNQSLFGYNDGNVVIILWQQTDRHWKSETIPVEHGEGLVVSDLNQDGFPDIVVNSYFLLNPSAGVQTQWQRIPYSPNWAWQDVFVNVADVNQDGFTDILVSPSEPAGQYYRISWFQNPASLNRSWQEHVIDPHAESVHHFIAAGDYDHDGDVDIFSAEMNQGEKDNAVKVYLNDGTQTDWEKKILSSEGSHSMRVADFDGDFDVELVGAKWHIKGYQGDYAVSEFFDEKKNSTDSWRRIVIGNNGPFRTLFTQVGPVDDDSYPDIVAGRQWFQNPGQLRATWKASELGAGLNNAVLLQDFNNDGILDVLASQWDELINPPTISHRLKNKILGLGYPGIAPGNLFSWGLNSGKGEFDVHRNIEAGKGDFLQGIATTESNDVLLSWHEPGHGIQALRIPEDPLSETWLWRQVTAVSQDEQLTMADINQDGIDDIVLGTIWLDGKDTQLSHRIDAADRVPDRNRVADFNHDGWPDILIGEEAIDEQGQVILYLNPGQHSSIWTKVDIGTFWGPMSLGIDDMDGDGDLDIVVGEHRLEHPELARLILIENRLDDGQSWLPSLISKGDEHHDGVQISDLDLDGDKDIVSIGWGHSNVIIYENLAQTPEL